MTDLRVFTRTEAIDLLGLSPRTWARLEVRGETPPKIRLSPGRIGYLASDLDEWSRLHKQPETHQEIGDNPVALYRHFSNDGALLYVGISLSVLNRLGQHKTNSAWFNRIARVEIKQFPTRKAALIAEARAIAEERPECNINLRVAV